MRGLLTLVALGLALLVAGTAQAQTKSELVSNMGETASSGEPFERDYLQRFGTGGNAEGYKLTSVDLRVATGTSSTLEVQILSADFTTSLGTLANPADWSSDTDKFTASGDGIDLEPRTQYAVFIDATGTDTSST